MLHTLLVPKLTSLSSTNEVNQWDNQPFVTKWPEPEKSRKGEEVTKTIKKKSKRFRTAFTTDQLKFLEKFFNENNYIDGKERLRISQIINVGEKQIKIWFQNRRMKGKRLSSESSSDSFSETSSVPSPALVTNDTIAPDVTITYTNNDAEVNNLYQPTDGSVESEYQLPIYASDNAAVNTTYGEYYGTNQSNYLDYYNYYQTDNNYVYAENTSQYPAPYFHVDNNCENTPAYNWYEQNNYEYKLEYFDWQ